MEVSNMSYVTNGNTEYAAAYYDFWGNVCDGSPTWEGSYVNAIIEQNSIMSWRGKRTPSKRCHNFSLQKYKRKPSPFIHACGVGHNNHFYIDNCLHVWLNLGGRTLNNQQLEPAVFFDPCTSRSADRYDSMLATLFEKANAPIIDSAVLFAELPETLMFLTNGLKAFTKMSRLLDILKMGPADWWLAYRYALIPLMLDITDVIQGLKKQNLKEKVQNYDLESFVRKERTSIDPYYKRCYFDTESTYTLRNGGALWLKSQLDPAPFGTGVWDIVRASWEVIPLSFVFDWFLDVNTWLNSLRDTNIEITESYGTRIMDRLTKVWWSDFNPSFELKEGPDSKDNSWKIHGYSMIRETDVAPPTLPVFTGWNLSLLRRLDAVALITTTILSLLRK
jgi:hypothetical protein